MHRGRLAIGLAAIFAAAAALAPIADGRHADVAGARPAETSARTRAPATVVRPLLAYTQDDTRGRPWIWSARLDGTARTRLIRGIEPEVSPNGRWIAFLRPLESYDFALGVVRADGTQLRMLVPSGVWRMAWLPDSSALVVQGRPGLGILGLRGERRLLAPDADANGTVGDFSVAADGSTVVFAREIDSEEGNDRADLFAVRTGGGPETRLTFDGDSVAPVAGPADIAYVRSDLTAPVQGEIWAIRTDGSHRRRLATRRELAPVFWPTRNRVIAAWMGLSTGPWWMRLSLVDPRTGAVRAVTRREVVDLVVYDISRDGRTILAGEGCRGTVVGETPGRIQTISADTGKVRVLLKGPCSASWNA